MNALLQFPFVYLVRREMISAMRGIRVFSVVAAVAALAIAITIYSWPSQDMMFSTAATYSRFFAQIGMQGLIYTCMLFVPSFAANTITSERRQETEDLLKLTLIRPSGVILAKLTSSVAFFIILIIAVMPIFGVLFFLVGIDWPSLGSSFAMALATAVSCGLIGIQTSANGRRGAHVNAYSYGKTLLLLVVLPAIFMGAWVIPLAALGRIQSGFASAASITVPLTYQAVLSAVLLALAIAAWQRPMRPAKGESDKPIDDKRTLRQRRWSYPFYLVDPLKRKKPIKDGQNPMAVKDVRWGLSGHGSTWARWFAYSLLASMLISAVSIVDPQSLSAAQWILKFQLAMTILIAPGLLANSFTKELESGGLDMLRITLLRPWELICGKIMGGAVFLAPILLSWMVLSLGVNWLTGMRFARLAMTGYATITLCSALCLASSLLASLLTRRSGSAAALSYFFAFMLLAGVSWIVGVFVPGQIMVAGRPEAVAFYFSPVYAFTETPGRSVGSPWGVSMIAFSGVCVALVACSVEVFKRMHLRDA